ncbi:energy transducer TonB [Rhodohalobacter sp. SW132]|uniref:energy transducer TonB n=1 Tax=Rhodohalobacter sp. SW132 TaxID=2293433 RepID=UPI001314D86A|nr:energy transducer TonB [Rhodohalobacter sp. SW132]
MKRFIKIAFTAVLIIAFGLNTVNAGAVENDVNDEVYTVVDEMPEIIGGNQALYSKITYPRAAVRSGVEGRVFIQFIVDKEGNVQEPKVLRDIGAGCGDAAVEAVKDVKFKPGRLNGEVVNVQFSMPVTFRLENN